MSEGGIYTIVIILVILLTVGIMSRGSCVSREEARQALETQGYSEVEILDHVWFFIGWRGCESSDAAKFTAKAQNPAGKKVEIFVCMGWPFKGATIRSK
ncbi:TPA: hypothetical protein DF272_04685 [Candidatus Falkowbacteria bacterium]|nr:hypothetical protein [Candidatus Falkowbacteria bacterium]